MLNGKQSIISESKIEGILADKWYNVDLLVKQNVFVAKLALEKSPPGDKYGNAPVILKGEDLWIKSGSTGLQTDMVKGAMFDAYKVTHEDCFVDPFDSDTAKQYLVKTNRYHELYKNELSLIYEQGETDPSPWVFKENFFAKKQVFYRKPIENEKVEVTTMIDKVYDTGSITYQVWLGKPDAVLEKYIYYSNKGNSIVVVIKLNNIKLVHFENFSAQVIFSGTLKLKPKTWSQFVFGSDENNITCTYYNA